MEQITLDLPEDLSFVKRIPAHNWSIVIRQAIMLKLKKLANLKRSIEKSRLNEKDVEEFTDKINSSLEKRYEK